MLLLCPYKIVINAKNGIINLLYLLIDLLSFKTNFSKDIFMPTLLHDPMVTCLPRLTVNSKGVVSNFGLSMGLIIISLL